MSFFPNKYIPKKDIPALVFITAAGTLSHFLYEWSGNAAAALFCPVNESVWEHLKLLFFPFLFYSLWNYITARRRPFAAPYLYFRLLGVLCGMLTIIMLFYTYTGIIGRHFLPLDILIFIIGNITALRTVSYFMKRVSCIPSIAVSYTLWLLLILCFFIFTCFPPNIPLFFSYPQ